MNIVPIVKRCQAGDRDAFGCLYNLYAPNMLTLIAGIVRNNDAAQDILHDGFIVAYTSIASINKPERFESWLTTIMRNLALQHLREEANHPSMPIQDAAFNERATDAPAAPYITWDVLSRIIDRLPEGYGKVFRLAMLDGLSHKEIGAMLGIAPHSSSSQLHHAKALLRKLITEYRIGMESVGISVIVATIAFIWLAPDRLPETGTKNLATRDPHNDGSLPAVGPERTDNMPNDSILKDNSIRHSINISQRMQRCDMADLMPPNNTIPSIAIQNGDMQADSTTNLRNRFTEEQNQLAINNISAKTWRQSTWSISLAYAGERARNESNRYMVPVDPNPDAPSEEPDITEVEEQSRHYMPVAIGLSLSKPLSGRWSLETGIRYTFLRSDYLRESKMETTETIQRIHYIGIPLKFNYLICGNTRFSLYGQGGAALDIPVRATEAATKLEPGLAKPVTETGDISAPLQWSVEGGLGLQYHITTSISIYAEPSLKYYFNPGKEIRTIRQDKPLEFTIPVGIRLTW